MLESQPHRNNLADVLPEGSYVRVEPHPGTTEGRQANRYWITEVADASVDPSDVPKGADVFTLQRVGNDFLRLAQESSEAAHPTVLLPLAACAFLNL